jgi:hypothetical protein
MIYSIASHQRDLCNYGSYGLLLVSGRGQMSTFKRVKYHISPTRLLFLTSISLMGLRAAPIVNMQLLNSPGEPNVYDFLVNSTPTQLLCDDAFHGVVTTPYQATEYTLSDLSGTLLGRNGDPNALLDYERIAMLDMMALADPSNSTLVGNVVEANWSITQNRAGRNAGATALVNLVDSEDPANFDLSGFVIFASETAQEQTGFVMSPEPGSWLLVGASIGLLMLLRRTLRRLKSSPVPTISQKTAPCIADLQWRQTKPSAL